MTEHKKSKAAMRIALCPLIAAGLALVLILVGLAASGEAAEAFDGYTLFASIEATSVSLMDMDGVIVHTWDTEYRPGLKVSLLENGLLLHTGSIANSTFVSSQSPLQNQQSSGNRRGSSGGNQREVNPGGSGGVIQLIDWDGNVVWEYVCSSDTYLQHHSAEVLPNGNVLIVAWEYKSEQEALDAGRDPSLLENGELWPDSILEIKPTGDTSGEIVWEWHAWDHLVQDQDASKENYGDVSAHPKLIDLNYTLQASADWTHINSADYNAELDQILLSVHNFGEIWIIDHSTTTEEAAGHSGGNSGCGGDLLYRWGNPQAYGAGDAGDQILFGQHDAEWIADGLPGEGNILIFNNGLGRAGDRYSSVDEITPPLNSDGSYDRTFDPDILCWRYTADNPTDFFAQNISSAQRLENGDTLICSGPNGYFFEVTQDGDTVWDYSAQGSYFNIQRYEPDYSGFTGIELSD